MANDFNAQMAIDYGRNFLGDYWTKADPAKLEIEHNTIGMCSKIYIVKDKTPANSGKINQYLIKFYGVGVLGDEGNPMITLGRQDQDLIAFKHGDIGCGPRVYGFFPNGRLEQYIESSLMNDGFLIDPNIRDQYMRKLARFHQIKVPIDLKQLDMTGPADVYFPPLETPEGQKYLVDYAQGSGADLVQVLKDLDWKREVKFLRNNRTKFESRTVLCGNDLQRFNCLIGKENRRITLIDYEVASYAPRGQDFGSMFYHWHFEFGQATKGMRTKVYPCADIRREMFESYLDETAKIMGVEKMDPNDLDSPDHLVMESDYYILHAAMFNISWAMSIKHPGNVCSDVPAFRAILSGYMVEIVRLYKELRTDLERKYGKKLNLIPY